MRILGHPSRHRRGTAVAASILCAAVVGASALGGATGHAADEDSYEVSRLTLVNLVGEVSVDVHDAPTTLVRFEGKKPLDSYLAVAVKNDALEIRGKSTHGVIVSSPGGGTSTVVVGGNSQVVISNGGSTTVIVGDHVEQVSGEDADWTLTLVVPKGQPLDLRGYIGNLRAGDIEAPLDAALNGASNLDIGAITSGAVKMAGAGTARIASVDGDLTIELVGAGGITVGDGRIDDLRVKITGSGDVKIAAAARRARITSIGAGDIEVASVEEKPVISVVGTGDVSIGNR